jgi:hypothetical protein
MSTVVRTSPETSKTIGQQKEQIVATAGEARAWARGALRGIGDSLYTPFCGDDGDDIDWDAYRTLVHHNIGCPRSPTQ